MSDVDWLADRLRDVGGVTVRETPGWRDRGRPGAFEPVGVLVHHTAAHSSERDPAPSYGVVLEGHGGEQPLEGPLCHVLIGHDGACHVVAAGRANHAGEARVSGPVPAGDGNALYVGIEIDYDGVGQAPTPAQEHAAVVCAAAIVSRLGHDASWVRFHRESSTTGKVDPAHLTPRFRRRVQDEIDARWRRAA